jgi:ribulose-5-phosphate 4-epimerase/fuculose-1-phosphate aldolase
MVPAKILNAFLAACREIDALGLVRCSSGNLSLRVDGARMLITASRTWMGRMTRAGVAICRIADGRRIVGGRPSVETPLHAGILRARPDANVALHFQSPFATALACRRRDPDYHVIPEIPFYLGPVARVPFRMPGSEALAAAVTAAMRTHDLAVLGNHGQVTVARDLPHAIQNAAFFELACETIVRGGSRVRPIPQRDVRTLTRMGREARGGV